MKLNFRTLGEGQPLIILHGVFGSADNWQSLGKSLGDYFKVYLVDQRNHGLSPHSDEFDYSFMSSDLKQLLDDEAIDSAHILGHSMGGKTAMHFAVHHPNRVKKLVVIDIAPKYYPPHHQEIFEGFRAVEIETLSSRKEAELRLSAVIDSPGVRMFLLKNLTRTKEGAFAWKHNLKVIEANIELISAGIDDGALFEGDTMFVRGANSDYILDEDVELIEMHFPNACVETVGDAGHWIHAEQPNVLFDLLIRFLM